MTTPSAQSDVRYHENVRVHLSIYLLLGALLGGTSGGMTGVAITGALDGSAAAIFFLTFGLSALLALFVLVNFANLSVLVDGEGLQLAYGMFRKRFAWQDMLSVEVMPYQWAQYGGWGIRFSTRGRRAWSQLFVKTGVQVRIREDGDERDYFVSSRHPEELVAALQAGIAAAGESTEPAAEVHPVDGY